ncbi:MAG: hypothetical protein K6T85_12840, partial [Gorillibacterium sp.]|nr:hypothetical protein [Gorillibacterium sp.]
MKYCLFREGVTKMEEAHLAAMSQVDSAELERLMEKYWKDIWHYAYFFMKNPELADDIAQETFICA